MRHLSRILVLATILIAMGCFWLTRRGLQAAEKQISVYIAGDSTACDYPPDRAPRTGWGQELGQFFTDRVAVRNEAISGRSSRSFIAEGALDGILSRIKPNDYLFIQFGHNDAKQADPSRYTEPFTSYQENLLKYIQGARDKGAIPVLLSPISRFSFDASGKVRSTHGDYPRAMRQLAEREKVPFIDMTEKTRRLMEELGPEKSGRFFMNLKPGESPNYPDGSEDGTHLRLEGATAFARLVIEGIREAELPLAEFIK